MPSQAWFFFVGAVVVTGQQFSTSNWSGEFDNSSGVLRSLKPSLDTDFDFSPNDVFDLRNGQGNYHTGDITGRWRLDGDANWEEFDSAARRSKQPRSSVTQSLLHSSFEDVFPELNGTLSLSRDWIVDNGDLVLTATIANIHESSAVELGSFGFPIEFNSILTNRTPVDTTSKCVFIDPYTGLDAGYVQVARLTGTGPDMIVTPYKNHSRFEGWRFLKEVQGGDLEYQSHTFEGFYSWETLTKAYAENEWNMTVPWNAPSSIILQSGQNVTFGLRFSSVQSVDQVESAADKLGLPVAVGLPGYVLASDMSGKLFLRSNAPVKAISTEPAGALSFTRSQTPANNTAWQAYDVTTTQARDRVRVTLDYSDGRTQTVHYYVTDPAPDVFGKHAKFLTSEQWFEGNDTFNRTPSVITYDYEARKKVLQERRVFVAGVQDEGGAASYVAAASKTAFLPNPEEVAKLEDMAVNTMWGQIQYNTDRGQYPKYSVRRSLFFYDPEQVPDFAYEPLGYGGGVSWNKTQSEQVWRSYNYVWVSTLYWSLYRAEKLSPGILKLANASWYLDTAYRTLETCYSTKPDGTPLVDYGDVGLMGETVWYELLADLRAEGLQSSYDSIESIMKSRQQHWASIPDPFGSEAPWDSTGQEAVYLWSRYFNDTNLVNRTLASIRGYMSNIPNWAYSGNARRWWDFDISGKLARFERQVHHYASPLNAVPLLESYMRTKNASFYDLRLGFAGWSGALTNVNAEGFGSQAFHAWPDTLKWDGYSSDYGAGLTGHMVYSICILADHPDFGLVAMGGNLEHQFDGKTKVLPRDTVRRRIYVAPLGLHVRAESGIVTEFTYDAANQALSASFESMPGSSLQEATVEWEDTIGTGVVLTSPGSVDGKVRVAVPGTLEFRVAS